MIQKRNGRQEVLDITKIQTHTSTATENLEGKEKDLLIFKSRVQIKLILSTIINSVIQFTYKNQNTKNRNFLSNIFGNNSSEKPHNY